MRETLKFGFILGVICIIAAGLLAWVDILTKPKIIAQERLEEELSLKEIFPAASRFEKIEEKGEVIYYKVFDENNTFIGVAFKASQKGYAAEVVSLAGMLKNGEITAIKILSQNETPGLGSRIAEPDFTDRFKKRNDLSGVEAITGATISSKAVIDSVKREAQEIRNIIANEK